MTENTAKLILKRMESEEPKKVFLDTDAANEVDDQFAIAYALLAKEDVDLLGLGAAPFENDMITDECEGMLMSYEELKRVVNLTDPYSGISVYKGSHSYLRDKSTPVESEAARAIVEACRSTDDFVFVPAIGCYTNVASAVLMDPSIKKNMVPIIVGTNDIDVYSRAEEYNLSQDPLAAEILMSEDTNFILLPAEGGTVALCLTVLECAAALGGRRTMIGDYLTEILRRYHNQPKGIIRSQTHIIWDIAAVSVLRHGRQFWSPVIRNAVSTDKDLNIYAIEGSMIYNTHYERDAIFTDLFGLVNERAHKIQNQ